MTCQIVKALGSLAVSVQDIAGHNARLEPAEGAQSHSVQPFLVRDYLD